MASPRSNETSNNGTGVSGTAGNVQSLKSSGITTDWDTIDWTYDQEAHTLYKVERFKEHQEGTRSQVSTYLFHIRENLLGWAPVLIIGMVTGVIAGMIDLSCALLSSWRFGYCVDMLWLSREACCPGGLPGQESCTQWITWEDVAAAHRLPGWLPYIAVSIGYGSLCAWLVVSFAPYAAGSGIPEIKTILSGIDIKRYLGFMTLVIKCVGLSLSVGSGLSLGKEGPFVHVATCVGNLTSNMFTKYRYHETKKREVLSASCAAGVAVAFGAPIGGVLFSLEEASYYFPHKTMWRAFFCAVVAALTLKSIDPTNSGSLVMFKVDYNHPWHWFELIPHAFLGVVGGMVGAVFNSLNVKWIRFKRTTFINDYPMSEVFCVTLVTSIINYVIPYLTIPATDFLSELFRECRPDDDDGLCEFESEELPMNLLLAGIFKFALTIFTFGIKVPAGLFIPSLFVGACCGRIVGISIRGIYRESLLYNPDSYLFSECRGVPGDVCVIPGVYAIVGAASVLGGVTRMTLSLVVIVFELTGGLEYLVPVMMAVIISKWVGEWVGGHLSIYETHIIMNGYPYLDPKTEVASSACVGDLLPEQQDLKTIPNDGMRIRDVTSLLQKHAYKGFPIVTKPGGRQVVGWVLRKNLLHVLEISRKMNLVGVDTRIIFSESHKNTSTEVVLDASWFIDSTPMQISPKTSINRLLQLFKSLGLRSILVTHQSKLIGIITRKDILEYLAMADDDEEDDGTPRHISGSPYSWGASNTTEYP